MPHFIVTAEPTNADLEAMIAIGCPGATFQREVAGTITVRMEDEHVDLPLTLPHKWPQFLEALKLEVAIACARRGAPSKF